jgi:hypothetical protein
MTTLLDYCSLVRSKNAGPFTLTFDFMCRTSESFDALVATGFIVADRFADLYGVPVDAVTVTQHRAALAIKVSMPRPVVQGSVSDSDSYAGQQYGPLMDLRVSG